MPALKTAVEMFQELSRTGMISPVQSAPAQFVMPTVLQSVPTFVTYGTPDLPIQMGTGYAGLEGNSPRNRG
jgi:hypothetical protein